MDLSDDIYNDNYWFETDGVPRAAKAKLRFKYTNTTYAVTERDFDVAHFYRGSTHCKIHGFCHLRQAERTLSSAGMSDVVDLDTGEVIHNIVQHLENIYLRTNDYLQDLVFDEFGWAIHILLYMGGSSGRLTKRKRDVVIRFVMDMPRFAAVSQAWLEEEIKSVYRLDSVHKARMHARSCIEEGRNFLIIAPYISELEKMHKPKHDFFWDYLLYIQKHLKKAQKAQPDVWRSRRKPKP